MKFNRLIMFTAASLAALFAATSPASADIGWETERGVFYWNGVVDNYGVFSFLIEKEEDNPIDYATVFFVDGLAPFYVDEDVNMAGVYSGTWHNESDNARVKELACDAPKEDPVGWSSNYWGTLELTFGNDPRHMTLKLFECGDLERSVTLNGKPGE
jgi:hypothetical protein